MKIHLIKDGDVSNETFTEVFDLLNSSDGSIQFLCDNDNLVDFSEDDYVDNIILNQDKFEKGINYYDRVNSMSLEVSNEKEYRKFTFPLTRKASKWETLFAKCNNYRLGRGINNDEFVILLTEISNDKNWFASLDEKMPTN
jgi:hypothetical protein